MKFTTCFDQESQPSRLLERMLKHSEHRVIDGILTLHDPFFQRVMPGYTWLITRSLDYNSVTRLGNRFNLAVGLLRRARPFLWDGHCCPPLAAYPHDFTHLAMSSAQGVGLHRAYLALLLVGFSVPQLLPATRCALTAPFHPCHPLHSLSRDGRSSAV
jgi:hypothetical protein